jgi:bifunctional non-homologous end joining protein LigD
MVEGVPGVGERDLPPPAALAAQQVPGTHVQIRLWLTAVISPIGQKKHMTLERYPPMLLTERRIALDMPGWVYEVKHDGYRVTALFGNGACKLRSRHGADATAWFPEVAKSLARIPGGPHIVDGEVCVFDDLGRSDFERLQKRARRRRWYEGCDPAGYAVFDLLVHSGIEILDLPLVHRKSILGDMLRRRLDSILLVSHSDHGSKRIPSEGTHAAGSTGIVAKRAFSPYVPGERSADWVKAF